MLALGLSPSIRNRPLGSGGEPGFPIPGVDSNLTSESASAYVDRSHTSLSNVTVNGAATMLFSGWFYRKGSAGVSRRIFTLGSSAGVEPLVISINSSNKLQLYIRDFASRLNAWQAASTVPGIGEWFHAMFSVVNNANPQFCINGTLVNTEVISIDPSSAVNMSWQAFGQRLGAGLLLSSERWNGAMAQVYLKAGQSLDLSVADNRAKFINSSGKPVDVGSSGQLPTGSSATLLFDNPFGTWQNNKGNGGSGFTASGNAFIAADPQPPV